jgi:hypothetical protein
MTPAGILPMTGKTISPAIGIWMEIGLIVISAKEIEQ